MGYLPLFYSNTASAKCAIFSIRRDQCNLPDNAYVKRRSRSNRDSWSAPFSFPPSLSVFSFPPSFSAKEKKSNVWKCGDPFRGSTSFTKLLLEQFRKNSKRNLYQTFSRANRILLLIANCERAIDSTSRSRRRTRSNRYLQISFREKSFAD